MEIEYRILRPEDSATLDEVAPDVFDNPVDPRWSAEFLDDPRHHLAVAIHDGRVVGMASGVHYVHPDKPPELWINEVGVAPSHHRLGIGRRLLELLFAHARGLGCEVAWVLTEHDNPAAQGLYASLGGARDEPVMYTFDLGEG
jgi:ribosomal protein S18 acetylase RimI-like enzyme